MDYEVSNMLEEQPTKADIMLEYRIAVLEGIIDWMLNNGVFVRSIEPDEMESVHNNALKQTRQRYPGVEISYTGKWSR